MLPITVAVRRKLIPILTVSVSSLQGYSSYLPTPSDFPLLHLATALTLCHPRYQTQEQVFFLLVNIDKTTIQLSACKQIAIQTTS